MSFLRVLEVLPPLFPFTDKEDGALDIAAGTERFTDAVRSVRAFGDVFLVANVKDPALLKLDTVQTAAMLREVLGVDAAPVIVVRDQNRPRFLSSALGGISARFRWVMFAWGDDLPESAKASNVRDYASLAAAIRDASRIRSRSRSPTRFFAPVNIDALGSPEGVSLAVGRLRAGADMLLAQPPTTDAEETFDRHIATVRKAGLEGRVILGVFPFRGVADVRLYERKFQWTLPKTLHRAAAKGEGHLLETVREVVRRMRSEKQPGVYAVTRGDPAVAEALLG
ncbi:MAG: hypothetical protein JRN08_06520 [Nitrososphaerota archaeon]|nr:hypothetical protein [Nitrososphaerota archaeon]